ncbi:MAG: hypothetical protein OEQ47_02475 [Acidimicrobiia bacterium]|nr:hypothetical protein [Acidimicrobiia bacterium]
MTIRHIETITMDRAIGLPGLVFLNIHTTDGLIDHGETYHVPALEGFIHDFAAQLLLGPTRGTSSASGEDSTIWRHASGARGAEMCAISAIELALWDLAGKHAELPVHRPLGGSARDEIPVYNTCGARPTDKAGCRPTVCRAARARWRTSRAFSSVPESSPRSSSSMDSKP